MAILCASLLHPRLRKYTRFESGSNRKVSRFLLGATEAERNKSVMVHIELEKTNVAHRAGVGALNRAFHLALIRHVGRTITTDLLERLHVISDRYRRTHLEPHGNDERANGEHSLILQRWLDRDEKGIAKAIRDHVRLAVIDRRRQVAYRESLGSNGDNLLCGTDLRTFLSGLAKMLGPAADRDSVSGAPGSY